MIATIKKDTTDYTNFLLKFILSGQLISKQLFVHNNASIHWIKPIPAAELQKCIDVLCVEAES